jgi:hypothetical protein
MSWCVEEYAEDAVKDYLADELDDYAINYYTAWTNEEIKYPCVVVHAGRSVNVAGTDFTGVREIEMSIAVMTEAADSGDMPARTVNLNARNEVVKALAQTTLHSDINALEPQGVVFSLAYLGDMTRTVETDKRVFVTEIQLITIAAPKELI